MKIIGKLYYFFGSIYFAVILIASVAFFVIMGTLIESYTDSHRFASTLTYGNPIFKFLLVCFFVNILFSALRRWPFKRHHIPFLITHLGLLMILTGCMIKSIWGTQGTMLLVEGSGSHEIYLPDTHVVKVEKKDPKIPFKTISGTYDLQKKQSPFPELSIQILGCFPNALEKLETWIKGDQLYIFGVPKGWTASHQNSKDVETTAKHEYLKDLIVSLKDTKSGKQIYHGPFNEDFTLDFNKSFNIKSANVSVSLNGPEALLNVNTKPNAFSKAAVTVDLIQKPKLHFIEDDEGAIHLFAFGPHGEIHCSTFKNDAIESLIIYDRGFGGYAVQEKIPLLKSREQLEKELHQLIESELARAIENNVNLSTPLEIFYNACKKSNTDFVKCCKDFLVNWDNARSWLYPENGPTFVAEEHIEIPVGLQKGCTWADILFDDNDPIHTLKQRGCPLLEGEKPLTTLTQQLFSAALPDAEPSKCRKARQLSVLFRAYEIHLNDLRPKVSNELEIATLEAPITLHHEEIPAVSKMEDNLPRIVLKLTRGNKSDYVSLVYNRFESGIKVPALDGEYLFKFQPRTEKIPYHVRLRNARQINYANSSQPFSFEADLLITDRDQGTTHERTISMNRVHETWDGYRFYLSNISPPNETAVKRVQLAVNHDPAKYILTYPGGLIVAIGSLLLFFRPSRKIK